MEQKKLWFKAKRYGYGWYPATWEGWTVLAAYLALFIGGEVLFMYGIHDAEPSVVLPLTFFAYTATITGALIWICAKRGEPARWRWGDDEPKK